MFHYAGLLENTPGWVLGDRHANNSAHLAFQIEAAEGRAGVLPSGECHVTVDPRTHMPPNEFMGYLRNPLPSLHELQKKFGAPRSGWLSLPRRPSVFRDPAYPRNRTLITRRFDTAA